MSVVITKKVPHTILVNGKYKGEVYLTRAESKRLKYWAISCVPGKGWNTYLEACDYAKNHVNYEEV